MVSASGRILFLDCIFRSPFEARFSFIFGRGKLKLDSYYYPVFLIIIHCDILQISLLFSPPRGLFYAFSALSFVMTSPSFILFSCFVCALHCISRSDIYRRVVALILAFRKGVVLS